MLGWFHSGLIGACFWKHSWACIWHLNKHSCWEGSYWVIRETHAEFERLLATSPEWRHRPHPSAAAAGAFRWLHILTSTLGAVFPAGYLQVLWLVFSSVSCAFQVRLVDAGLCEPHLDSLLREESAPFLLVLAFSC